MLILLLLDVLCISWTSFGLTAALQIKEQTCLLVDRFCSLVSRFSHSDTQFSCCCFFFFNLLAVFFVRENSWLLSLNRTFFLFLNNALKQFTFKIII